MFMSLSFNVSEFKLMFNESSVVDLAESNFELSDFKSQRKDTQID